MWNSITSQRLPRGLVSLTVLSLGIAAAVTSSPALADEVSGAVYVLSNSAAGNKVLIYGRHENGELTYSGSVPTGGKGTITPPPPNGAPGIDPLGSQGSLVYHDGLLIAVNAGSNDISLFRAEDDELTLLDRVPSGGGYAQHQRVFPRRVASALESFTGLYSPVARRYIRRSRRGVLCSPR
jgi:hypothetical protein